MDRSLQLLINGCEYKDEMEETTTPEYTEIPGGTPSFTWAWERGQACDEYTGQDFLCTSALTILIDSLRQQIGTG